MSNQHYEHMPNKQRAPQQQHGQQYNSSVTAAKYNSIL